MDSSDGRIAFRLERTEACFCVEGEGVLQAGNLLFGPDLKPHTLQYRAWLADAPLAGVLWLPPSRLEIRIPADHPWPHLLSARLAEIANAADVWADHLSRAIARLEEWIESDTEAGGGVEELASDLQALEVRAPTPEARQAIRSAMDALDDGLPAEAVAAALYRARQQIARN